MNAPIVHLANLARMAVVACQKAIEPPPKLDYLRFARQHVVFTEAESQQFAGPYNERAFPFFSEILKALSPEDPCRIVTLKKSAQIGGTIIAVIVVLGAMETAKGLFLYVHPTDDNARRWSKTKLKQRLAATTVCRVLFPRSSRDQADSVLYKERTDGAFRLLISGANSPASLSMITAEFQVQDDLSKWVANDAGDPEAQADSRSQAVEFAKIFKVSTPLVNPGCKITRNYLDGTQEEYEVPCPHCDGYQVLRWENLKVSIEAGHIDDAHFTCEHCGCEIHEYHRAQIITPETGRWVARNPRARRHHRSFHIWAAYSQLTTLQRIAYAWLKARGHASSEQTFLNDVAGLAFETAGTAPPWEDLRQRADASGHQRGRIPAGGLVLTMGMDCQGDRVEWHVVAWARDGRSFVIDYGVEDGHISESETRAALDRVVLRRWRNEVGRDIALDKVAIDGNAYTDDVLAWARRHPAANVIVIRGVAGDNAPKLKQVKREITRLGRARKHGGRFYNVGTSIFKLTLYHNLAKTDPLAPGFIGFPQGMGDEYFKQLTSERRKEMRLRNGAIRYDWVKDEGSRNEALDTYVYASAAAFRYLGPAFTDSQWDRLEAERETPPPEAQLDLEDLIGAPGEHAAIVAKLMAPPAPAQAPPPEPPKPPASPAPQTPRRVLRKSTSSLLRR